MLLVDDDEADVGHGGKQGGTRAHDDVCAPTTQQVPLVEALPVGQAGVQDLERKRPTVWAVSEISGTSTMAPRPRDRAASIAAR